MPAESNKDCIVLVPVSHHIEPDCDASLRMLERMGYHVWRAYGFSAIDQGRNVMAQQSLDKGYKELMWIDADVAFQVSDVERLRALNLPLSCGIYGLKDGSGRPAADLDGKKRISGSLYQIPAVGAGFLHTRRSVYELMIKELKLEKCVGRHTNYYPFFLPLIKDKFYMGEDFAFCHRASQCGIKIVADTSLKLKHVGKTSFRWSGIDAELKEPKVETSVFMPSDVDLTPKDDLAVITCFFNPAKFKRNLHNAELFRKYLNDIGCPLYVVELAFGDDPFQLTPTAGEDDKLWQIRTNDVMWHKERLLNLLAAKVPRKYTKIVWADADVYWPGNPRWFKQTSEMLDYCKVVQPFSNAEYLTEVGALEFTKGATVAAAKRAENWWDFWKFHPGFCFAARRELFDLYGGLYDKQIIGSGDSLMALAFMGEPNRIFQRYAAIGSLSNSNITDYLRWAEPVAEWVGGSYGYVDTTIQHMWHGELKDRRYSERLNYVKELDPNKDLVVNQAGLYSWAPTVSQELRDKYRAHFYQRQEDRRDKVKTDTTCIITAVDSNFFEPFKWWWDAVQQNRGSADVLVYDLGLTLTQKLWLVENCVNFAPASLINFDGPTRDAWVKNFTNTELKWLLKPFLIKRTNYDNVLWLDVDALPVRPLQPLIDTLKRQPIICDEAFNPGVAVNDPALYQLLPVSNCDNFTAINAGVLGFNLSRDYLLFNWWIHCVYCILMENPEDTPIKKAVAWMDQGALLWALHKTGMQTPLSQSAIWNHPANGQQVKGTRKDYNYASEFFLEAIRKDHPRAHVVHWMGTKQKFELWPKRPDHTALIPKVFRQVYEALTYEI